MIEERELGFDTLRCRGLHPTDRENLHSDEIAKDSSTLWHFLLIHYQRLNSWFGRAKSTGPAPQSLNENPGDITKF